MKLQNVKKACGIKKYTFHGLAALTLFAISSNISAAEILSDTNLTEKSFWGGWIDTALTKQAFKFGASGCTVSVFSRGDHEYDAAIQQSTNIHKNKTYLMTIVASADSSDRVTVGFKQNKAPWFNYSLRTILLKPQTDTFKLTWVNTGENAVEAADGGFAFLVGKLKGRCIINKLSVVEQDTISSDKNDFGCLVPSRKTVTIGNVASLPKGFVVFSYEEKPGTYISELSKWNPVLLPGSSRGSNIDISDDGRWILYTQGSDDAIYVTRIDGKYKTSVTPDYCFAAGFLRSGPYGQEIYYSSRTQSMITALKVSFGDSSASFGQERIIAKLDSAYEFENYYKPILVCKDQIWSRIKPFFGRPKSIARSGFLTIPDSGRGIATWKNVTKFKNEDGEEYFGCNHAMSHDGKYCVAVGGGTSETGDYSHCSPVSHKGFMVTKFFHDYDTMVENREIAYRYAYSLNWCPPEYHYGEWSDVDFGSYSFTNNDSFLVCSQKGDLSTRKGLWAINWQNNTWYPLSPDKDTLTIRSVAAFVGNYDTKLLASIIPGIDPSGDSGIRNPIGYTILKPSGGEVYYPGDVCTLKVVSKEHGNAAVKLQFGKKTFTLIARAIDPQVDSIIPITIPEYFLSSKSSGGVVTVDTVRTYSTQCNIVLEHYTAGVSDPIYSTGYFTIASRTAVLPYGNQAALKQYSVTATSTVNKFISSYRLNSVTSFTMYDLMGRCLVKWNMLSGKPFPTSILKRFDNHNIHVMNFTYTKREN